MNHEVGYLDGEVVPESAEEKATTPQIKKLELAEKLKLDNLTLQLQNISLQEELLSRDLEMAAQQKRALMQEHLNTRNDLAKKYAVDWARVRLLPDGTIQE